MHQEFELPDALKNLYRHWEYHLASPSDGPDTPLDEATLATIHAFATERMHIWQKKTAGAPPPYTGDPILRAYRFCNIYRKLDRQTIEYHRMLADLRDDFPRWLLNMFFCRLVCRPETVADVGLLSFDPRANEKVEKRLLRRARPTYDTAYVFPVSTLLSSKWATRERFACSYLPAAIPRCAEHIAALRGASANAALNTLLPLFGFNHRFLWTEVLIDVAYQYPEYINLFADFPVGPGAIPTAKKLNPAASPERVCEALARTRDDAFPHLRFNRTPVRLSAENWEGVCCEFRKYTNRQSGVGRKRLFTSH